MSQIKIRCRAVIMHEGKLLVVRHAHANEWYALPGGHLDYGEDPQECIKRELEEELGVEAEIGRLLYVYTFIDKEQRQSVEFFFEIKNGDAFTSLDGNNSSHAFEIAETAWIAPETEVRILPEEIAAEFKKGTLLADEPRFLKG